MCYNTQLQLEYGAMEAAFNAKILDEVRGRLRWPYHSASAFVRPDYPILCGDVPDRFVVGKWGLIPSFVKQGEETVFIRKFSTFNAKSETAFDLRSFKAAIEKRRCIVPATAFYEWMHMGKLTFPHMIYLKNRQPFGIAGIWEQRGDDRTFAILTCDANPLMERIHNTKKRMPVIIPDDLRRDWLNPALSKEDVMAFCVPYPEALMSFHTISRRITDRTQDPNVPETCEPFEYPELALAS